MARLGEPSEGVEAEPILHQVRDYGVKISIKHLTPSAKTHDGHRDVSGERCRAG